MEGQQSRIQTMAKDIEAAKKELENKSAKPVSSTTQAKSPNIPQFSVKTSQNIAPSQVRNMSVSSTRAPLNTRKTNDGTVADSQTVKPAQIKPSSPSNPQKFAQQTQNPPIPPQPPPIRRPYAPNKPTPTQIPPISHDETKQPDNKEKTLTEILKDARSRVEVRASEQTPDKKPPSAPNLSLGDVLPLAGGVPSAVSPKIRNVDINSPSANREEYFPKTKYSSAPPAPKYTGSSVKPAKSPVIEKNMDTKQTPEEILGIMDAKQTPQSEYETRQPIDKSYNSSFETTRVFG